MQGFRGFAKEGHSAFPTSDQQGSPFEKAHQTSAGLQQGDVVFDLVLQDQLDFSNVGLHNGVPAVLSAICTLGVYDPPLALTSCSAAAESLTYYRISTFQ